MATVILYFNAALSLLTGGAFGIGFIFVVGQVAAGLGIANERKWGYWLGVVLTGLFVLWLIAFFSFGALINLIFYGALLGLLLHPQSRSYLKTWFRWK
jgi:hypothetical protein